VILGVTLLAGLALGRRDRNDPTGLVPILRQVILLVLLVLIFSFFGITSRLERFLGGDIKESLEQIHISRKDLASYGSGYLQDTNITSVDSALRFLPVGLAYFLAVPLPWHIGSFRQNLAIPETFFWCTVIYPMALRGIRRGAARNLPGTLFLVLSCLAICCFYALFIGNIGTAYRTRIQVWAIVALLAGWGWPSEEPARVPGAGLSPVTPPRFIQG
jgi:hypothetical protein